MNGEHLDRFCHGVCTMVPLGAWVPWAEVVQIASGHGFNLETCFHCAEHWLTLGALEMDPMWRPGKAIDPTEVVRIRFLYHRYIHGEQGLVCVSSEEEDLDHGNCEVQLEHTAAASTLSPRRWKTGVLDPIEGVEVTLPLPQPLDKDDVSFMLVFWHLFCQHQLDQRCRYYNLAPDIPPWAFTLFASPGFKWTTARVKAFQQSLLDDLEAQEDPVQNVAPQIGKTKWGRCNLPSCTQRAFRPMMGSRGPFLVCSRQKCHGKRNLTPEEWTRLPRMWQELWPVEWCNVPFHQRPKRPVACLRRPRRRCPRSRISTFFGKGVSEFSCYFTFISPCFWWVLFVCRQKTSKAWNTPCTSGCEEGASPEAQERAFAAVFTSSFFAEKASAQSIHSGTSAQKCRQECSRDTESSFQGRIVSARFAETVGSEVGAQTSGYGLLVLPKGMSFLFLWVVQAGSQAEASTLPQQSVP